MRRFVSSLILVAAGSLLAACSDSLTPGDPGRAGRATLVAFTDSAAVRADLNAIYPSGGIGTAANAQLSNIFKSWSKGSTNAARQQAAAFCDFTQKQAAAGRLHAPAGTSATVADAVTSLCNESYLYVNLAPGGVDVSGLDATAQFIPACTPAHVRLPNGNAIVDWPARAPDDECIYDQDVTLIITPIDYTAFAPGDGPLGTTFDQWPFFYDITTSPLIQPHAPVRVSICTLDDGSAYSPPASQHGSLRIGHQRSAAVGGGFEVLPSTSLPGDLACFPPVIGFNYEQALRDGGFLAAGRGAVEHVAHSALDIFTPKAAYAAHGGLAGLTTSFSPFGAVNAGIVGFTPNVLQSAQNGVTFQPVDANGNVVAATCVGFTSSNPNAGSFDGAPFYPYNPTTSPVTTTISALCDGSPVSQVVTVNPPPA